MKLQVLYKFKNVQQIRRTVYIVVSCRTKGVRDLIEPAECFHSFIHRISGDTGLVETKVDFMLELSGAKKHQKSNLLKKSRNNEN